MLTSAAIYFFEDFNSKRRKFKHFDVHYKLGFFLLNYSSRIGKPSQNLTVGTSITEK